MITERDRKVIEFVERFKVASTSTIQTLFYPSERVAQRRLATLVSHGELKRSREHINLEYMYYIQKPKQLKHRLLLTEFYKAVIKTGATVNLFQNEMTKFEGLRPDGFISYTYRGTNYIAFIEVEISNNGFNIDKYKELFRTGDYKKFLPTFPKIIVVTNKNVKKDAYLEIIKIKESMENISEIFY